MNTTKPDETPEKILEEETVRSLALQLEAVRRRGDAQYRRLFLILSVTAYVALTLGVLLWINITP